MSTLSELFENNRAWAESMEVRSPGFFTGLVAQQAPLYLWIGCSDSRVPANELVGLLPGELFVHRNIANVVVHSDLNCLSVVQFATDMLKVKHIIVVGHSGCGGVASALHGKSVGLADNWLRFVRDVRQRHQVLLDRVAPERRVDALVELNVVEQALNVCQTTVVQDAWAGGQPLTVHGLFYQLGDGRLKDLAMTVQDPAEMRSRYEDAILGIAGRYS